MGKTLRESIQDIEDLIRTGNLKSARNCIRKIQFRRLEPSERIKLAELTRKLGQPFKTIRLLNPLIRNSSKSRQQPTPQEQTFYAAALIKIGASAEALSVLKKIEAKEFPQSLLFQSHALFTFWNYKDAIPLLRTYVGLEKDEYQKIVGEVNLAAALVQEQHHSEGEKLLAELLLKTKRAGLSNFEGNSLEILAQLEIQKRNWKSAERCLENAKILLSKSGGLDEFFVEKWQVILDLLKNPNKKKAVQNLYRFQEEAEKRQHWETLRECDRYLALATENNNLFYKVYFGTPHEAYRKKLKTDFGSELKLPEKFIWLLREGKQNTKVIKVLRGEKVKHSEGLKVGQLKHRLLRALVSDFYRPVRLPSLFASLYPNEYFHPVSSPARVYQAIKELRIWFSEASLPLDIKETQGSYQLVALGASIALEIPHPDWWGQNPSHRLQDLRSLFGEMNFTAAQVSQRLGIPRRTAVFIIHQSIEAGLVRRIGSGPQIRYQFQK